MLVRFFLGPQSAIDKKLNSVVTLSKLISFCYSQQIEFLRGLAITHGYTYKAYCQKILRDVDKETGQVQGAMYDFLHGSDNYYDRLTSFLEKDYPVQYEP